MSEYASRISKSIHASNLDAQFSGDTLGSINLVGMDPEVLDVIDTDSRKRDKAISMIQEEVKRGTPLDVVIRSFDIRCLDEKGGLNRLTNNLPIKPKRENNVTFY